MARSHERKYKASEVLAVIRALAVHETTFVIGNTRYEVRPTNIQPNDDTMFRYEEKAAFVIPKLLEEIFK